MKIKLCALVVGTSLCVSQFASAAALTAICTNVDKNSESNSVLKVTVNDDWKNAFVVPVDMPNVVVGLDCVSKTLDEQTFQKQCSVELFNMPGVMRGWMTFTQWDSGEMDLMMTVHEGPEYSSVGSSEVFSCVKD